MMKNSKIIILSLMFYVSLFSPLYIINGMAAPKGLGNGGNFNYTMERFNVTEFNEYVNETEISSSDLINVSVKFGLAQGINQETS